MSKKKLQIEPKVVNEQELKEKKMEIQQDAPTLDVLQIRAILPRISYEERSRINKCILKYYQQDLTYLLTYLLTYNLASLSGPKAPGPKDPIDVKSDEAIQI